MKPRIFVLLVVLVLLWSATAAIGASSQDAEQASSGTEAAGTPVAVVTDFKYEFKPVVDGSEIAHDYRIKNTGDGPLAIERVRTG